jgi:hypothetical protein
MLSLSWSFRHVRYERWRLEPPPRGDSPMGDDMPSSVRVVPGLGPTAWPVLIPVTPAPWPHASLTR